MDRKLLQRWVIKQVQQPVLIEHTPNPKSSWNKLSINKNCSKSKKLWNDYLWGLELLAKKWSETKPNILVPFKVLVI